MDSIEILKKLIACRSVTPATDGSLDYISDLLAAAGYTVRRLPQHDVDNLLAYKGDKIRLLFAGHVDVVPPGDLSQWHSDPFCALEKDGMIIGRGAADMKSGVAAMVAALLAQPTDGVGVFLTSDEEGTALHGTKYFTEWWQQQGYADIEYCIVGEPTCEKVFGDAIKIGRRGSLTGILRVNGKQEHAAYAYRGDNPIHRLLTILQPQVAQWQDNIAAQARGEMVTTFQIVDIKSGVGAHNVTPPIAEAIFNFRYALPDTAEQLQQQMHAILDDIAAEQWTCEWQHGAETYKMPEDSHLVSVIRRNVEEVTSIKPALTSSGGSSDGRFLRHVCSEVAEFGVLNASIHAPNESVFIKDARELKEIYIKNIQDLL